jgi:hypothetical protein
VNNKVRTGIGALLFGGIITQEYFTGFFSNGAVKGNQFAGMIGGIFVIVGIFIAVTNFKKIKTKSDDEIKKETGVKFRSVKGK